MTKLSGTWARVLGIGVLATLLFPVAARAAVDAFMKIDGVAGNATDDKHKDWIEISSFETGPLQMRAESERAGRMVRPEPLVITRAMDESSPKLRAFCANGKHFSELDIDVVSGGRTEHYRLMNVTVNSYTMRKAGGKPLEEISFSFDKVTVS
jgi:type VI secretion system secreted protein Hcp